MAEREAETLLFVYGTLRRGAPMHALLRDAPFVAGAQLQGRLWDLGTFPGFTDSRSGRDVVKGELFRLPSAEAERSALLESLDRYEGDAFERALREAVADDGSRHAAFVFLFIGSTRRARRIASGDYLEGARSRDPGIIHTTEEHR